MLEGKDIGKVAEQARERFESHGGVSIDQRCLKNIDTILYVVTQELGLELIDQKEASKARALYESLGGFITVK